MNTGNETPTPLGPPVPSLTRRRYQRRCSVTESSLRAAQKLLEETFTDDVDADDDPIRTFHFPPVSARLYTDSADFNSRPTPASVREEGPTSPSGVNGPVTYFLPACPLLSPELKETNNSKKRSQSVSLGYQSYTPCNRLMKRKKIPELSLLSNEAPASMNFDCKRVRFACNSLAYDSLLVSSTECQEG
jgi:hypothetical protein